jgi:hypothetical protein
MEDDIDVVRNPRKISDLIDALDRLVGADGWDILFTDPDTKGLDSAYVPCFSFAPRINYTPHHPERFAKRTVISADFQRIGARYGAYSMIIRRSGMKKLSEFFKKYKIFLPYDMEFQFPPKLRLFSLTYDLVSTKPGAFSDNNCPRYLKRQAKKVKKQRKLGRG